MNKEDIPKLAEKLLSDYLHEPGGVLYSSHETLKPGKVYLLGFNPGGSNGSSLANSLDTMLSHTENAYIDECWCNGSGSWDSGEAPLQRRIDWLLTELGLETREVCASNLIFLQSRTVKDIGYELADICWPVHEAIMDIIKPNLILAFGNSQVSPYEYLHSRFGGSQEELPAGHGSWRIKGFSCQINGRPTYVAGLPHLSRYSPIDKHDVTEWLKTKLG